MAPLIIMAGPSGVGKTTMATKILAKHSMLTRVITTTTRPPREGERHGIDYFFVSNNAFIELNNAQAFLEVNNFNHFWYGTPRSLLHFLGLGCPRLILPDINGARKLLTFQPKALTLWLDAPHEVLAKRLAKRNTESIEKQAARLAIAQQEKATALASGLFSHFIDMTHFEGAYAHINNLIQASIALNGDEVVVPQNLIR